MKTIAAVMLCLACGAPLGPAPAIKPLEPGAYYLSVTVREKEGDCDWVQRDQFYGVDVDNNGSIESPLPDLVKCTTAAPDDITIEIRCTGFDSVLEAHGEVWNDRKSAVGSGTARGNVGGCRRAAFGWIIWQAGL